jgi:indolepyruvate ferredoxin oxidoreductase beta subunit
MKGNQPIGHDDSYKAIFAGVGGQGVFFLSRLHASAAVLEGNHIMASEIRGMSRRGGAVVSHLSIGNGNTPMIQKGTSDMIIALNENEAIKNLPFLKQGGEIFVNAKNGLSQDIRSLLKKWRISLYTIDADRYANDMGDPGSVNVIMAGFVSARAQLPFGSESIEIVFEDKINHNKEFYMQAYRCGFQSESVRN